MPVPATDEYTDSLEAYLTLRSGRTNRIYLTLLLIAICALAALPLVHVPVSVRAPGIIRPDIERHDIRAPATGFVERVGAVDNQLVRAGDEIVMLQAGVPTARTRFLEFQLEDTQEEVSALEGLLTADPEALSTHLTDPRLKEELEGYLAEVASVAGELIQGRVELARSREMAARGLAPVRDVEAVSEHLERTINDSIALVAGHRSRWASELRQAQGELERLTTELEIGGLDRQLARVTSPVTGTLEEVTPISPGSYVSAGTSLFMISPASPPVAEIYVSAREIGMLRTGGAAKLLIDSFNHHVWGYLEGEISSISDDHVMVGDQPTFVVEVALGDTALSTRSGAKATVSKGMTLRAQFQIAERSLWQLLRDDVGDWLDPGQLQ